MLIIPAVNARTREEALSTIKIAASFARWIHIDVADGKFAPVTTWGDPEALPALKAEFPHVSFEVHLMVQDVEDVLEEWLKAGASRIIIHQEAIENYQMILSLCEKYGAEAMLSIPISSRTLDSKVSLFKSFQILAVPPGFAGQDFDDRALFVMNLLKTTVPNAKIEVDGGINPVTVKKVESAGATIAVSASYIFNNPNPREASENLSK